MSKKLNFIILTAIVIISLICSAEYTFIESTNYSIDTGDTAWMIVASAFVLLMTPGLAFFYGGLVNRKNVISTMLQSFVALGVISVLWVFIGFSLAFGESYHGIIGNPFTYFNFNNVTLSPNPDFSSTIPFLLFALFQLKFAIIAPALIQGDPACKVRSLFSGYVKRGSKSILPSPNHPISILV